MRHPLIGNAKIFSAAARTRSNNSSVWSRARTKSDIGRAVRMVKAVSCQILITVKCGCPCHLSWRDLCFKPIETVRAGKKLKVHIRINRENQELLWLKKWTTWWQQTMIYLARVSLVSPRSTSRRESKRHYLPAWRKKLMLARSVSRAD